MSENPFAAFTPKKEWLVCVDSDGCAMDTMDSKHHQAFCPQLIRVYGLEEYAGLITPHWMEVNLYSRTRGVNRFKGLAATMRMLAEHGVRVPGADELCTWVEKAPKLSNPALEEAVAAGGGAGLQKALEWSRAVNAAIAAMGDDSRPFPGCRGAFCQGLCAGPCADGWRRPGRSCRRAARRRAVLSHSRRQGKNELGAPCLRSAAPFPGGHFCGCISGTASGRATGNSEISL